MAISFLRFLDHTQRRTTVGRTTLEEWSTRRRDLYLTTHNTHNRQTSMPPVGFEPTISAGERLQIYALDRAATGTGKTRWLEWKKQTWQFYRSYFVLSLSLSFHMPCLSRLFSAVLNDSVISQNCVASVVGKWVTEGGAVVEYYGREGRSTRTKTYLSATFCATNL